MPTALQALTSPKEIGPSDSSVCVPSADVIIALLEKIRMGTDSSDDEFHYQLTFVPMRNMMGVSSCRDGDMIYTSDDLAEIRKRYDRMSDLLTTFMNRGYKIEDLTIQSTARSHQIVLKYLSPKNRRLETQYNRDIPVIGGERGFLFLPDDFLHDLRMIPERG